MLTSALSEALLFAEEETTKVDLFYETHKRMPENNAEAELAGFQHIDRLQQMLWSPGVLGLAHDTDHVGTLSFEMDLTDFGSDFEADAVTFLFIGQGDSEGSISWQCIPDSEVSDSINKDKCSEQMLAVVQDLSES